MDDLQFMIKEALSPDYGLSPSACSAYSAVEIPWLVPRGSWLADRMVRDTPAFAGGACPRRDRGP